MSQINYEYIGLAEIRRTGHDIIEDDEYYSAILEKQRASTYGVGSLVKKYISQIYRELYRNIRTNMYFKSKIQLCNNDKQTNLRSYFLCKRFGNQIFYNNCNKAIHT